MLEFNLTATSGDDLTKATAARAACLFKISAFFRCAPPGDGCTQRGQISVMSSLIPDLQYAGIKKNPTVLVPAKTAAKVKKSF